MRVLSILLATGLFTSASAQPQSYSNEYPATVDQLSVTLPSAFSHASPTELEEGALFWIAMTEPGDVMSITTTRNLSWVRRQLYKRGWGLRGSSDGVEYVRMHLSEVALDPSLEASATSAFRAVGIGHNVGEAGILVRGCEATFCYTVTAAGPSVRDR